MLNRTELQTKSQQKYDDPTRLAHVTLQVLRNNLLLALEHLNYDLFNTICELYITASYQKDDQARKDFFDTMRQRHLGSFLQGDVEQIALHNPDLFAQVARAFARNLANRHFYR